MAAFNVTIIGAGIAGLTTAIALLKQNPNHRITIIEKSTRNEEFGAALHLGPNCTGFLEGQGLRLEANAGATVIKGMRQVRGASGEEKMKLGLSDVSKLWKNPWYQVHRVDFHKELKRVLLEYCSGSRAELILGAIVEEIDVESGQVLLSDGRLFESDVVLGADGNASICRSQIDPDVKLRRWDKACYRFLVPRQTLLDDPETRDLVVEDGWFGEVSEADRRIVHYSCKNNEVTNVCAFVPNALAKAGGHDIDWNQPGDKELMLKAFENWYPAARKFLSYAPDDLRVWQLFDMPTLGEWTKGRLAVIGDAAHPFLPFLGQGASMAIEDSMCITEVLRTVITPRDIPKALEHYQKIRKERVEWTRDQARINAMNEDVRPPTKGGFVMLKVCHDHDETQHSREKLESWGSADTEANMSARI